MRIHRDANMSIHKTTYMRIHLDANMSFHKKTGNRGQSSEQPGWAAFHYPGSHPVPSPNAPYRHPQWARCAQPAGHLCPRVRPRAARTPAAGPTPPCPHAAPHAHPLRLPDFPGAATTAQPRNPEPLAGNHNQCAPLSAVIINANTNTDNPTTRAVMFHLGTYIPQGVPDTYGFNGIDTARRTATPSRRRPHGVGGGLGGALKLRGNGDRVRAIGDTGG